MLIYRRNLHSNSNLKCIYNNFMRLNYQKHGSMRIMPAGVHFSRVARSPSFRRRYAIAIFENRQRLSRFRTSPA